MCRQPWRRLNGKISECELDHGTCTCEIVRADLYVEITRDPNPNTTTTYTCNRSTCSQISTSRGITSEHSCNTISITTTTTINQCPTTTINQACPTTTHSSSRATCNSAALGAIHGGYVAVILVVLVAIIITLVILMGYLVKRTTPQRGPVQTTHQSLTDMAASDYMEPVALRQLQTSTDPGQ